MMISIYISNIIYKFGGTESYTANLIESLQRINSDFKISIITEHFKDTVKLSALELSNQLNAAYGVNLSPDNLLIQYIDTNENKSRCDYYVFQKKVQALTKKSDIFFYCSRGLLRGNAKVNIAIIHFPMNRKITFPIYCKYPILKFIALYSDWKYMKNYSYFLPNSQFTAYWLRHKWDVNDERTKVLYPPVEPVAAVAKKNKNQILICSRIEKSKKIEDLMRAYLSSEYLSAHCVLIVAGSIKSESIEYREFLKSLSDRIVFVFEPTRKKIEELYASSSVFWHAKGLGETDPYLMEHFGISTVEAMSAGCIPVVINKGGQKEIVNEDCGYVWDSLDELIAKTEMILKDDEKAVELRRNSIERSKLYLKEVYTSNLQRFLSEVHII